MKDERYRFKEELAKLDLRANGVPKKKEIDEKFIGAECKIMRWIVLLLALAVSMAWIAEVPNRPVSDQKIYYQAAYRLADGQGYVDDSGNPTAYWAPGYAFYLATMFLLFDGSYQTAFFANFLSFLFLIGGIYLLGRSLYSERVGFFAALGAALYPSFILYNTVMASETLFSALMIWALIAAWHSFSRAGLVAAAGLMFGAAALVRPQALVLPIVFFVIASGKNAGFFSGAWRFAASALLMIAVCLPWSLRNEQLLGSFVLVSANSGANFWMGNHEGATGGYMHLDPILMESGLANASLTERDHYLAQEGLEFVKENPLSFITLIIKRIVITFKSESIAAVWNQSGITERFGERALLYFKLATNFAYYLLFLTFLGCLARAWAKGGFYSGDRLLFTMMLLLSLPFIIFIGQDRFHLPLIPYALLFISRSLFIL